MTQQIIIKEIIVSEHKPVIDGMMRSLHESEHGFFNKTASWDDIEAGYMRHIIAMQEECDGTCLVAYVNDTPAGFIFGYTEEQDDSRIEIYTGIELYISDGYVMPAFRRQGIYQQMNVMIEHKYIQKGVKRITRYTLVNNKPMQQLLAAAGYQPTRMLFEKWL